MKRRKITYPVARTHTKGAPKPGAGPEAAMVRPNLVAISGSGLYAGEEAVIERLVPGVIPAATVRTDAGGTRRVRTIDLDPIVGPR